MEGSDEYFAGRRWRVASEVTGTESDGPATVTFTQGRFSIAGGKFSGPGSSARGAKGILLQEIDERSEDIPGSLVAVGESTFRKARKAGAVLWAALISGSSAGARRESAAFTWSASAPA